MDDNHQHEYQRPFYMKVSGTMTWVLVAILVALGLPPETNFFLSVFCIVSATHMAEHIHFMFVEKPIIRQWIVNHMKEYHGEDIEK